MSNQNEPHLFGKPLKLNLETLEDRDLQNYLNFAELTINIARNAGDMGELITEWKLIKELVIGEMERRYLLSD